MSPSPIKPPRLREGDTVAVLSPSWGGPSCYPHVFDAGLKNIRNLCGVRIKEFPTARMTQEELYQNPQMRAEDVNGAFADPDVQAIIASIGGNESVRILRFLDIPGILSHPKILMGYSDTTTLTTTLNLAGLVTFSGPSVMAGFAQMRYLPAEFSTHVRDILMSPTGNLTYNPYPTWTDRYVGWDTPGYDGQVAKLNPHDGWRWLQGAGMHRGVLFGGNIEVLEFMKATPWWPKPDFWKGVFLFLETSEEKPDPQHVEYMLRNYGSMGALEHLAGLLVGRARDYSPEEKETLYEILPRIVGYEFDRPDMPIVANLDFGHTDPQWVLPLGIEAALNCERQSFQLLEPAVV